MKAHTRLSALLLAVLLSLSLTACTGGTTEGEQEETDGAATEELLPDDFVVDTAVEDLCLATAGVPGDFALFTVDGVPVSARMYLYWLATYLSSGYTADTMGDAAVSTAALYAFVPAKAGELGVEMTQEQIDELEGNLALTVLMMGGEDVYLDTLRKIGLDEDTFYQINAAAYYYEELLGALFGDRPTDEEMAAYIEENDILCAKHILLATIDLTTGEALDDETVAAKKATAESLLFQLRASSHPAADFDDLMNEYSEDTGLSAYPDGYTFTAGEMVEEFETATRALEYGEVSDLVESAYGYHIILRLDPDTEDAREEARADLLDAQLQEWLAEAEYVFSDEFNALDADLFYAKFQAYQEAFAAEEEESAAEDETSGEDETAGTDAAGETGDADETEAA